LIFQAHYCRSIGALPLSFVDRTACHSFKLLFAVYLLVVHSSNNFISAEGFMIVMVSPSWLSVGLGAIALLPNIATASSGNFIGVSPSYRGNNRCPEHCSISGPNPGNWSLVTSLDQIDQCKQTKFYQFSIYDQVEDPSVKHQIYSCASIGSDWTNLQKSTDNINSLPASLENGTYQFMTSSDGYMAPAYVKSLSKQMRQYISAGFGDSNHSLSLFAQFGTASAGLYIGKGLQNEGVGEFALKTFESYVKYLDMTAGAVAIQFCQPGIDGDHVFGFVATSNSSLTAIQTTVQLWSNAKCLSAKNVTNISGPVYLTTPLSLNLPNNSTGTSNSSTVAVHSTLSTPSIREWNSRLNRNDRLNRRSDCTYVQVASGDGCSSLAQKCGISQTQFRNYNPSAAACGPTSVTVGEYVCCSPGTLPDFSPKPNADGSCASYTVQTGDNCANIAAANSITTDQLNEFNTNTWGWKGCDPLALGNICLSTGSPPMPAPVANSVCGPTVPGTAAPAAGIDISTLNPCPLNACCDIWGQVSSLKPLQLQQRHVFSMCSVFN
jgi:hypothetical protein